MSARIILTAQNLKWLTSLVSIALLAGVACAEVPILIPDQHPGPPIYARVLGLVGDSETAVIVFYRSPACVPEDFNLPAIDSDLLIPPPGSEILMEGSMVLDQDVGVPKQEELHEVAGTPVPIWFVDAVELWAAIDTDGDGIKDSPLTIGELESMSSLRKGQADSYHEILHALGGATMPLLHMVASGVLEPQYGGDNFYMLYTNAYAPASGGPHPTLVLRLE